MNRGEVWWVEHPEAGRRPHLLLTRQAAIPVLTAYIAVPATRKWSALRIPTEVRLGALTTECPPIALSPFDNIAVIPSAHFVERITKLRPDRL